MKFIKRKVDKKKLASYSLLAISLMAIAMTQYFPNFIAYAISIVLGSLIIHMFIIRKSGQELIKGVFGRFERLISVVLASMIIIYIVNGSEAMDAKINDTWNNVTSFYHQTIDKFKGEENNVGK